MTRGAKPRDHRRAHERWRRLLPEHTAWLVQEVRARLVPEFERRGFVWYPDHADGDPAQLGASEIPLQRRDGPEWPTVQIRFHGQGMPWLVVEFGLLPPVCRRHASTAPHALVDIPREEAALVDAPEYFILARGERRRRDCEFGYQSFRLCPRRFLGKELDRIEALLPEVFRLLEGAVPREQIEAASWPYGKVTDHVALAGGRRVWEERARRRERAAP